MSRAKPAMYQSTQLRRRCLAMNDLTAATLAPAAASSATVIGSTVTPPDR
jgi:hypothetical protein